MSTPPATADATTTGKDEDKDALTPGSDEEEPETATVDAKEDVKGKSVSVSEESQDAQGSDAGGSGSSQSVSSEDKSESKEPADKSSASASASAPGDGVGAAAVDPGAWQAIWSPQHNAYYFYNALTNETTWNNPLASQQAESSTDPNAGQDPYDTQASSAPYDAQMAAAIAQGIDPALAYLDPSLGGPSNPGAYTYVAKFNARTGQFAKPDARNSDHVSEYERMKRMSEFYFDVNAWQAEVDARHAAELEEAGKKRKKPTKKDLELFKERKRLKKIAKTAWLRT